LVLFRAREFVREPAIVFWALIFPLVMIVVLGLAFRPRPPEPLLVLVATGDAKTEEALRASKDLNVRALPLAEAERALTRGEAALLVLPAVAPGTTPTYRFDPTHPEARATRSLVDDALQRARGRQDVFVAAHQDDQTRGTRYVDWFVPGVLSLQIMNGALWGVGFALVDMRAKKLLKRFAVTPMLRWQFLLAQALHRFGVVIVEATLMVGFSYVFFDVRVQGSLLAFGVLATFGTFAFASLGLLVAARPRNTEVAAGLMNVPMLPQMVFSGVFFSSARFPDLMQPFIKALPLTALVDGLRRITNEGAGLDQLGRELVVLALWAVVTLVLALRWFKWS
jgi:ABC transporter DrrB family efflux protein